MKKVHFKNRKIYFTHEILYVRYCTQYVPLRAVIAFTQFHLLFKVILYRSIFRHIPTNNCFTSTLFYSFSIPPKIKRLNYFILANSAHQFKNSAVPIRRIGAYSHPSSANSLVPYSSGKKGRQIGSNKSL